MATELSWWRLDVDADGKVTSCKAVERAAKGGSHCFYVKAHSAKEAARLLSNEISRRLLEARRAKYEAEGRCKCGGEREDAQFKQCLRCRKLARVHHERKELRQKGVEPPPRDRRDVLLERKELERASAVAKAQPTLRLDVLLEVSKAWQDATTNGAFTRWLNSQIADARGKRVA